MLLMQAHQFEERGIPFLCIKSSIDTRDVEDVISSRIGIKRECISIDVEDDIYSIVKQYITNLQMEGYTEGLKWILVDECQFLTKKQINQLSNIVDYLEINVLCYGLRTDFTSKVFEGSKRLLEIADDISEIKSSCSCGRKAIINARFDTDGQIIVSGEQILIGGNDMYVPLCRKCYKKAIDKLTKKG